jgi:hypothetical protein
MPKVNLTGTYGYRNPATREMVYYGPGMGIEVPQGLVDTLGLDVLPEAEVKAAPVAVTNKAGQEPATAGRDGDLPEDFPGRKFLVQAGHTTLADVKTLSIDQLIEVRGIGTRLAEQILQKVNEDA